MKKIKFAILALALATSTLYSPFAHADIADLTVDTGCSTSQSYTGVLNLTPKTYDVYVRLAKRGETATIQQLVQPPGSIYGQCADLGAVAASGDHWTKSGTFTAATEGNYVVQLTSDYLNALPDANRPSVMVVPAENPPCVPDVECVVDVEGQRGFVRPVGTLLNQDSLHVLSVVNPADDTITAIRYYVDEQLVYQTKSLQPFDERYIAYAGQDLKQIIEYESGQQVVIQSQSSSTHSDNFFNFIFRLTQKYPVLINGLLVVFFILLAGIGLLLVLRIFQRKHNDRLHHGFIKSRGPSKLDKIIYKLDGIGIFTWVKLGVQSSVVLLFVIISIVGVNRYILQIIEVDGRSMQKTFATGDQVLINKIPKTAAMLNGREYVPKRGEVVIVRAVFGTTNIPSEQVTNIQLIKRVIGLPGERVVVKDGILTIYNKESPEGFQPDNGSEWQPRMTPSLQTEAIDIQLTNSEIFVTGDNRPESIDSRFSGPLNVKEVIGTVWLRVWPFGR